MDKETVQTLLDLLNPLHGSLDKQTYDEKSKNDFDAPLDAEYNVTVLAQMERDLTQAVLILEDRQRQAVASTSKELDRTYRALRGLYSFTVNGKLPSDGVVSYHSPTIAAAIRFVDEGAPDGSDYFIGKPIEVLHSVLAKARR